MTKVKAVYENGVFKPIQKLNLKDREEVQIAIFSNSELEAMAQLARDSGSFDFLKEPAEDIYTIEDGNPIE